MRLPVPRLLRWIFVVRLAVAGGLLIGAMLVWRTAESGSAILAILAFLATAAVTLASSWHLRRNVPSDTFLYGQVLFDVLLVTTGVHLTGGAESVFAPLYILVIAEGALLLPVPGGMLIAALASLFYFADIVWGHDAEPPRTVLSQIGLFALVALATAYLGERFRRAGSQLGAMQTAMRQLRLDTADILGALETGVVTVQGTGRLADLNPAGEGILGLPGTQWLGRPVLEELDRRAPGLGTIIEHTASRGSPVRWFETRVRGHGDDARVLGARTTLVGNIAGEPGTAAAAPGDPPEETWVTAVFQDITDGKRLQDLHRRAERLEALAEMAASLAHEIKNPLASIRSAVEQLAAAELREEDRSTLERLALAESDRLSRLLSDFIEFSRVQVERRRSLDLGGVVADAVALVRRHPDGAGATIEYQPPEEPVVLEGDADLLHRATFNLVLNAVQHSGPEGLVRVIVDRISPQELPPGLEVADAVRLAVADSGPGVAPEDIPRIFDPFFSTRPGGTGLGLALVHRAVSAHRGEVVVDRAPEGGARFSAYLPASAP